MKQCRCDFQLNCTKEKMRVVGFSQLMVILSGSPFCFLICCTCNMYFLRKKVLNRRFKTLLECDKSWKTFFSLFTDNELLRFSDKILNFNCIYYFLLCFKSLVGSFFFVFSCSYVNLYFLLILWNKNSYHIVLLHKY